MQLVTQVDISDWLFHIQKQIVVESKTEDWTELRTTARRLCSTKSSAAQVSIINLSQKQPEQQLITKFDSSLLGSKPFCNAGTTIGSPNMQLGKVVNINDILPKWH